MASGSNAPFSGEFVDLENVPKLPEGISAEQVFEQNADALRQAAESRHAAGLSQVNADGGFFDAFVDQSKISTITGCQIENLRASLTSNIIEDFEDESIQFNSNWNDWGTTSNLSIETNNPISGTSSLALTADNEDATTEITKKTGFKPDTISLQFKLDNTSTNDSDAALIRLQGNGEFLADINISPFNNRIQIGLTTIFSGYSANQVFKIVLKNIDYSNNTFDLFLNGTDKGQFDFSTNANQFDELRLENDTSGAGITRSLIIDNIKTSTNKFQTTGNITTKNFTFSDTQGNNFSPSKIGLFPEQNLNGQSLSYDLKDSSGSVVETFNQADLNQLIDVSTADTTFQIEANLSGDGSQTPELEFLDVRGV